MSVGENVSGIDFVLNQSKQNCASLTLASWSSTGPRSVLLTLSNRISVQNVAIVAEELHVVIGAQSHVPIGGWKRRRTTNVCGIEQQFEGDQFTP